jgi:ABC-type Fe3+ transport system substrate-binding protein
MEEIKRSNMKLDFLGNVVCPLKSIFLKELELKVEEYRKSTGRILKYHIPGGCGRTDEYDDIWKTDYVDELPDLIFSKDLGQFVSKEFIVKFIKKGYFKSPLGKNVHEEFIDAGCIDPEGEYWIYSVAPTVMLIDKIKLGNLPEPRIWNDLLKPQYKNNIIIGGRCGKVSSMLLPYIYKERGEDGLKRLASNVKDVWSAPDMAKVTGINNKKGAAINVINWSFAKLCPNRERVSILWPEDGAVISPFYMLSKKSKIDELSVILDIFLGSEYGQKAADMFYPSVNIEVDNHLPENAKFKWLGWDYVKNNDFEKIKDDCDLIFEKYWEKSR